MAAPPLSPERVRELHERIRAEPTITVTDLHRELGFAKATIVRHWPADVPRIRGGSGAGPHPIPPAVDPVEAEKQKAERDSQRREYIAAVKELAFRDFLRDLVHKTTDSLKPPPPSPRPRATTKGHVRFPLLHLSDWHFEEIVRSDSVLGMNAYDIPTACRRVYRVVQAFRDWAGMIQSGGRFTLPELTVALNGDLLTGTLHGLERHSSAPNVVRAAKACGRLIALAIRDLAADFQKVRVMCSYGNHGRLPDDKKMSTKDPTRNWDYVAYSFAEAYLAACTGVSFTLPDAYGLVYDVAGHAVFQGHGNFVKQQLGIVGYGMRRFVSNLAANMGAAGRPLRYAVFGHFHQANLAEFAGVTAFIGPSLIGTQEHGFLSGGSVNRPAQQCYLFDRDLGHVSTENLYGDGPGYDGTYEIEV